MPPRHHTQLARALCPALAAAHDGLQPGLVLTRQSEEITLALSQLQRADQQVGNALRSLIDLVDDPEAGEQAILMHATGIAEGITALIEAYGNCRAADRQLAEIARDTLLVYAHFLADLIITLAAPGQALREIGGTAQGDGRYLVTLECSTALPQSPTELSGWTAGHFTYDESRVRRALSVGRLSKASFFMTSDPSPPPPPPPKGLSFWELFGLVGLFSLLFGHHHDCNFDE